MTLIKVSEEIRNLIAELQQYKDSLAKYSEDKVQAEAEYEKELAKTILSLKNGGEHELEGEKIKNPPVTIIEKISKGLCWEQKLKMDKADQTARNNMAKIEITKAQLNAYQSINKNLDEI